MPRPAEPPLAIFDHDGVLVDTLKFHQDSWTKMGRETGLAVTPAFILETFGMTNAMILRKILGESLSDADVAAYSDRKEAAYRDLARGRIVLMDGVRDFLDELTGSGVRLAIGSSGVRANLELTVEECGLHGRFASIVAGEDVSRGKPDPQVFQLAASRAEVPTSRAVVFEDAPVGIRAAKAAGMLAVGVTSSHSAEALWAEGADEVVADLRRCDVQALIARLTTAPPDRRPS
ncbi:HAD family hydrolase [Planctomyces sp. SH-PL62]|uniref:HAD family hydrolase n=1 Tax=Planctomyces sp. SH-PL62 TaxID=1636152 RepID=UPI00078BBC7C|nr:HAD family phosphatase [Planctomyces sp. SH-PL62]AMV39635.1 Fructose-1-phosphate phosphatase YqaB [Planctomyces sp. SH-PL62]